MSAVNAEKSWLTAEETRVIIHYVVEVAACGFPLSHRRLKEHVDEICRAHLGDKFPAEGVGKCWTNQFIEKHSRELKTLWSCPLEVKHGQAVNPAMNEAWFNLVEETFTKYNIKAHNTYAVDKLGCQPSGGEEERIIGGWKPGPQYQQRDGNHENITVLVTICADGTSTPPAVIFKGTAYQVKWAQNNPANAS